MKFIKLNFTYKVGDNHLQNLHLIFYSNWQFIYKDGDSYKQGWAPGNPSRQKPGPVPIPGYKYV